jgi:hypothetical protein
VPKVIGLGKPFAFVHAGLWQKPGDLCPTG